MKDRLTIISDKESRTKNRFKAYRLEVVRTRIAEPMPTVTSSRDVARRWGHLAKLDREHLLRLDLDNRNQVIGEETVSIGTINATLVSPREVFKGAILNNAARIILLHNHPAGDPGPSSEDRSIRERLTQAGELLAIPVLDFLIIGQEGKYWSPEDGVCQISPAEFPMVDK